MVTTVTHTTTSSMLRRGRAAPALSRMTYSGSRHSRKFLIIVHFGVLSSVFLPRPSIQHLSGLGRHAVRNGMLQRALHFPT
ncbi:hypothetical protein ABKN59_001718 [Abortiporus biennis]